MIDGDAQKKQATLINKFSELYVEMSKPSERKGAYISSKPQHVGTHVCHSPAPAVPIETASARQGTDNIVVVIQTRAREPINCCLLLQSAFPIKWNMPPRQQWMENVDRVYCLNNQVRRGDEPRETTWGWRYESQALQ